MTPAHTLLSWAALEPLANHLWQSTVFAAAAGLLTRLLRTNRARTRHWLWVTASIKFLVPFSLLAGIGSRLGWLLVSTGHVPHLPSTVESIGAPFVSLDFGMAVPSAATATAPHEAAVVPSIFLALWLCGCAAILTFRCVQWRRLGHTVRQATPLDGGREFAALRRLERVMGIRQPIRLLAPLSSAEPGVFGIRRPVLLLPADIGQRLGEGQLDAVLAHELCHVRRRDNLTNAGHMLVEAIFWFHPLVWWIGSRLVEERERACDEEVLDLGGKPEVYAESILETCLHYLESPAPFVSGVTGSDLKRRIERIMTNCVASRLSPVKKLLLAAAGFMAVALPLTLGLVNAPRGLAQSAPLAFEVASVKPDPPDARGAGIHPMPNGQGYTARAVPLRLIVKLMYKITDGQIVGGPKWMDTDLWDIEAKAEHPSTLDQLHEMFQTLLADRFKLQFHRDTREISAYVLTVDKSGSKLKVNDSPDPFDFPIKPAPGRPPVGPAGVLLKIVGNRVPMSYFTWTLSGYLNNVSVVDKTGLDRFYDLELQWLQELPPQAAAKATESASFAESGPDGPALSDALREQLGLKLERRKAPAEVFVIDRAEKPEAN
jgi:uncharacterized protein (TIGR03435 family)